MKRDMDLVRDILSVTADSTTSVPASAFTDKRHDFTSVAYHIDIMAQAGLVVADVRSAFGATYISAEVKNLTWEGQEFLSTVKDDAVWSTVKKEAAKKAVDLPFTMLAQLALKVAQSLL